MSLFLIHAVFEKYSKNENNVIRKGLQTVIDYMNVYVSSLAVNPYVIEGCLVF